MRVPYKETRTKEGYFEARRTEGKIGTDVAVDGRIKNVLIVVCSLQVYSLL